MRLIKKMDSQNENSDYQFCEVNGNGFIFKSICEQKNVEILYSEAPGQSKKLKTNRKSILSWNQFDSFRSLVADVFLPKGYPYSVSSDYLEYQLWDTCQAFCSSISGTLSMSAVMEGVGVGSQTATPVSAAITWIMKDGTGMLGSILFAWSKGSKLDSDCKKWRLFADVLNDVAMCIEMSVPLAKHYSMYILCLSTAMKALVGVAGSATRAALTCHQAIRGNMADVSAKDGSQEIFVNLCAYIFGIFLLKNVTEADKIWTVMCTFILLHLFFNYKAVSCLKINVYNGERYRLSLRSFLVSTDVPTVEQVNRNESVVLGRGNSNAGVFGLDICLGSSTEYAIKFQKLSANDLSFLADLFQTRNYFILPYLNRQSILVSFRKNCSDLDIMKGYFHAVLVALTVELLKPEETLAILKRKRTNSPICRIVKILNEYRESRRSYTYKSRALPVSALLMSEEVIEREFAAFCKLSEDQGWRLDKHLIHVSDWRADWKYVQEKRVAVTDRPPPHKRSVSHRPSLKKVPTQQTISGKRLGYGTVII